MGIALHCEHLKIVHNNLMKVVKNAAPLHERFNNVHHGFMGALEIRISFFLSRWKICTTIYEGQKKRMSFVWALQQCASRFYEGLRNTRILFSEPLKNMHNDFMKVIKKMNLRCTSAQQCASRFSEGLKNVHRLFYESFKNSQHDLWNS